MASCTFVCVALCITHRAAVPQDRGRWHGGILEEYGMYNIYNKDNKGGETLARN